MAYLDSDLHFSYFFYHWLGGICCCHTFFFSLTSDSRISLIGSLDQKKALSRLFFLSIAFWKWYRVDGLDWFGLMEFLRFLYGTDLDGGLMFFLFIPEDFPHFFFCLYLVFFFFFFSFSAFHTRELSLPFLSFHFLISAVSSRCPECWYGFRFVFIGGLFLPSFCAFPFLFFFLV